MSMILKDSSKTEPTGDDQFARVDIGAPGIAVVCVPMQGSERDLLTPERPSSTGCPTPTTPQRILAQVRSRCGFADDPDIGTPPSSDDVDDAYGFTGIVGIIGDRFRRESTYENHGERCEDSK